jgi:hypothetical protein
VQIGGPEYALVQQTKLESTPFNPRQAAREAGGVHRRPSIRTAKLAMVVSVTSPRSLTRTMSSLAVWRVVRTS